LEALYNALKDMEEIITS